MHTVGAMAKAAEPLPSARTRLLQGGEQHVVQKSVSRTTDKNSRRSELARGHPTAILDHLSELSKLAG